jgi:hypothetical protein
MAVWAQELAFTCLDKNLRPLQVCERSRIQLKDLLAWIDVMKFQGGMVALISAQRATPSK